MKPLCCLFAALCLAVSVGGANRFVTPNGAGNMAGTAWTNAIAGLTAGDIASNPGDVVWFSGTQGTNGTPYPQFTMTVGGTIGNPITFQRATSADPIATSSPGWQANFDSQAVLSTTNLNALSAVNIDNITVDGRTWEGLSIIGGHVNTNDQAACIYSVGNNHTFRNIGTQTPYRADLWYAGLNYGSTMAGAKTNLVVQYCHFHLGTQGIFAALGNFVLVEYCEIDEIGYAPAGPGPSIHPNPYYTGDSTQVTYRYNRMHHAGPTGVYISPFGFVDGFYIYGDIWYNMPESFNNGINIDPNTTAVGTNFYAYNDTFSTGGAAIRAAAGGTRFPGPSILGGQIANNAYYLCSINTATNAILRNYDWFSFPDVWSASETNAYVSNGANPFRNPAAGDFHLTSNTVSGVTLPAPFTTDPDNVARIPGAWSRGAYQFVGGGSPPATPSNVSPSPGAVGVSLTPLLQLSAYSSPSATPQGSAQFWVYDSSATNVLWNSGPLSPRNSATVPPLVLSYSSAYWWNGRYGDSFGLLSAQSPKTLFVTTNAPPVVTNVVIMFQGGGQITINGSWQSK